MEANNNIELIKKINRSKVTKKSYDQVCKEPAKSSALNSKKRRKK